MPTNLVLDAQLSKDSYSVNNVSSGVVNGWTRVAVTEYKSPTTVESGANFAAQMYQGADGTYKIAFRGTENPLSQGDRAMNGGGIVGGNWTPEMQQAMEFTRKAIRQIADDKGIEFKEAAKLFTVTGHSQGGFEAELAAKMFGLSGTSQDGPGASRFIGSTGYNAAKAAIQAQEPGAVLDGELPEFVARQYTVLVGGMNDHISGVEVSKSALPLILGVGQVTMGGVGLLSSLLTQATVFHKLDNIIAIEQARAANPWLQKIVQIDDAGDGALGMASVVAGRWSAVQVAGGNVGISANDVQGVLKAFLQGREGQGVSVQENQKTFYVQASSGDTLILMPDGSGVSTVVQGIQVVQKEYAKGGVLSKTLQAQRDDDGNLLIQSTGSGYSFTASEDISGQLISSVYRTYNSQGQLSEKTIVQRQNDGTTLIKTYDKNDVLQSETKHRTYDDGSRIETSTAANGLQTVRTYDDEGTLTLATTHSPNADGEAWTRQEFDANGNITEVQTAVYDSKKGFTEVEVFRNGTLIGYTTIEGKATQAQLDKALNIAEQLANATSFGATGKSDSGESFLDTLNILDAQETAQLTAGVQTLSFADTKYSGTNVASTPVFTPLSDYSKWLVGRGTQASLRNGIEADPSLLGLQDGALTLALARQNPNAINVMRALQSVVLAGGVLSETFKQSVANQLGTNTADVNTWVASGGAAITSFLVAMDKPTVANVTSAAISMINAGLVFTPSLTLAFAANQPIYSQVA